MGTLPRLRALMEISSQNTFPTQSSSHGTIMDFLSNLERMVTERIASGAKGVRGHAISKYGDSIVSVTYNLKKLTSIDEFGDVEIVLFSGDAPSRTSRNIPLTIGRPRNGISVVFSNSSPSSIKSKSGFHRLFIHEMTHVLQVLRSIHQQIDLPELEHKSLRSQSYYRTQREFQANMLQLLHEFRSSKIPKTSLQQWKKRFWKWCELHEDDYPIEFLFAMDEHYQKEADRIIAEVYRHTHG